MSQQTRISDDRLAQIVDHEVNVFDWEVPIIAAELLARRAAAKQEHTAQMNMIRTMRDAPEKGQTIAEREADAHDANPDT
jgi:hypothetical protein